MTGAHLPLLGHEDDLLILVDIEMLTDKFRLMSDDDDNRQFTGGSGIQGVASQRFAEERVDDLWDGRFEAGALTGSEKDEDGVPGGDGGTEAGELGGVYGGVGGEGLGGVEDGGIDGGADVVGEGDLG